MKVIGYDQNGRSVTLPYPIQARIEHDYYGASALTCKMPVLEEAPDLASVQVYFDGACLFYGTVDKQTLNSSDKGRLLSLSARDFSAFLLDNEAAPRTFTVCTLNDLYTQLVRRHGIGKGFSVNPGYAPFQIHKGYSEYEAIQRFCRLTGVGRPFVDVDRRLKLRTVSEDDRYAFGGEVWPLLSAEKTHNRHQPITDVILMQRDTMQYSLRMFNYSGLAGEVSRQRYKKLFNYTDEQARLEADRIMAESRAGSRVYTVKLPGLQNIIIGRTATLDFDGITAKNLVVTRMTLALSEDGLVTEVALWPRADVY